MPPVTPTTPAAHLPAPRPESLRARPAGLLGSFAALLAGPPARRPVALPAPKSSAGSPAPATSAGHAAAAAPERGASRRPDRPGHDERTERDPGGFLSLDPLDRALLAQRPPLLSAPLVAPAPAPAATTQATPLDQLVERLLRRVAVGGSRERGVAVLRVGAGPLDGAQLTITAEGRSVRVEVSGATGAEAEAWRSRLEARLRQRGLDAHVEVT